MSNYENLLNAIKNTASGKQLTLEQEDSLVSLNEIMNSFSSMKTNIAYLRNASLAYASKDFVTKSNKSITGDVSYSGVNNFTGSLISQGTIQLSGSNIEIEGYVKTEDLPNMTVELSQFTSCANISPLSDVITVPVSNTQFSTVKKLYKLTHVLSANITMKLDSDLFDGDFRSYIIIIRVTASNFKIFSIVDCNNNKISSSFTELNSYNTNTKYVRQQIDIYNLGGILSTFVSNSYFNELSLN